MVKLRLSLIIVFTLAILVSVILFLIGAFKPKVAGVYVQTNPESAVFINGESIGTSPIRTTLTPGETILKLVPQTINTPLVPYEAKVNFVAGVETVINLDFGETNDDLASEIISFEKIANGESSLVIVSIPDSAQIVIDGRERAFAPHKTSNITEGVHQLTLSAKGYKDRNFEVKTHDGYKLTAVVKLARDKDVMIDEPEIPSTSQDENELSEGKTNRKMVEILSTGTGFLRVRSEAKISSDEVGRVDPGKTYPLVEEDNISGWYKIEYLESSDGEEPKTGWISGQYANIVENIKDEPEASSSATVTPTSSL